jgi:hypothetical protein
MSFEENREYEFLKEHRRVQEREKQIQALAVVCRREHLQIFKPIQLRRKDLFAGQIAANLSTMPGPTA